MCAARVCRELRYRQFGQPRDVLRLEERDLPLLAANKVLLKFLAAPINPADINQIQGVYPSRPDFSKAPQREEGAVAGNEGLAEVLDVGPSTGEHFGLKRGDWVLPAAKCLGTWRTHAVVEADQVLKVPRSPPLTVLQAATLFVNPCTAYRMLRDFGELEEGDYIIQNAANSAVGQYVIQLAKAWGYRTVNVVRSRPQFEDLAGQLKSLGADIVVEDSALAKSETRAMLAALNAPIKLGLNAVGGKAVASLSRYLAHGATLVTYGGMGREPVTLPTSSFVFQSLHATGFWVSQWYEQRPVAERIAMWRQLIEMYDHNQLSLPPLTTVAWDRHAPLAELQKSVLDAVDPPSGGKPGLTKQVFLFGD